MSVDYKVRIIYADVIDKVTKTEEAWKDVCRLAGQIYRYEFDIKTLPSLPCLPCSCCQLRR